MMSTENKKTPQRPITEKNKPPKVFDHQIHQKLATDVNVVSFIYACRTRGAVFAVSVSGASF